MKILADVFTPASLKETDTFLKSMTVADQDATRTMWDQYSGAKGLLDARIGYGAKGYRYYPETGTYERNTDGHRVTEKEMVAHVRRVSTGARNQMRKETQQLIAGTIILAVWYSRMRSLMKALYNTVWLVTIGGFLFDDDTARNLFYLWVLMQYNYLDRFAADIGRIEPIDGRAVPRAGMYGEAGNGMYQNMRLEQKKKARYDQAKRILGDNENHCEDDGERPGCIDLASQGWIPINAMIPIGEAACYSNCHCTIVYRRKP